MNPPGAFAPWTLELHDLLPSTSDTVRAAAQQGAAEGLAVLATQQSAGRGTQGRVWQSVAGNLHLSVLLRPHLAAAQLPQYALLAALALRGALAAHCAEPARLTLKWPNDVLLDGRKLAGLLIESATVSAGGADRGIAWLVIGAGANLAVRPDVPGRDVACLADLGPPPAPQDVARGFLRGLDHWRGVAVQEGFAAIRAAWLAQAHPIGSMLRLAGGDHEVEGHFAGLAEDGGLILRVGATERRYISGEIISHAGTANVSA